ncbi:hypothetical protein L5186_002720 [Vibrio parahaemolyticus]|nr:hypothetical protein [Vibrio parahaemolyticus]EIU6754942.1 hypothetical protein [Vibrio parahaemolyticus]
MEGSIFAKFEKTLNTAFVNIRCGNELLFIDVDLSKALFWNFQENMRDLMVECDNFGLEVSKIYTLAARQHDLISSVRDCKDESQIDVRELKGEELEPHVITALTNLESIELHFMKMMKLVGDKHGFEKFRAAS